jgi:hypothetical protein
MHYVPRPSELKAWLIAKAWAVKTARYPVLYKKLKAPAAARKALKSWKKDRKIVALEETDDPPALECRTRLAIQDAPRGNDENSRVVDEDDTARGDTEDGIELQNLSDNSRPQERTLNDSGTSRMIASNSSLSQPPTSPSNAVVVHKTLPRHNLPPQHMTFSEPLLEKTRRGNRLRITCTLEPSYPNFHIECDYTFIDKSERINSQQTDTRLSFASILTKQNIWVIALEQKGYNEAFIKGCVGEAGYARLESEVSGSIKGHRRSTESAAPVGKKISIPEGFDLGGIWCKAADFYRMKIFIPGRDYREKNWQ